MINKTGISLEKITINSLQIKDFVEFCKKHKFSEFELKILEILIKKTKSADLRLYSEHTIKQFVLSAKEIADFCNTSISEIDNLALTISENFITKPYKIKGSFNNLFVYFVYQNDFKIGLNPFFIQHFINIKEFLEDFNLCYLLKLKNYTSMLLYKALRECGDLRYEEFSISALKQKLGLDEKYSQYGPLKLRVIDVAIKDINTQTELTIKLNQIKTKQTITKLKFSWGYKPTQEAQAKQFFAQFAKTEKKQLEIRTSRDVNLQNSAIDAEFNQFIEANYVNYQQNSIEKLIERKDIQAKLITL